MTNPLEPLDRINVNEGLPDQTIDRFVELTDTLNSAIQHITDLEAEVGKLKQHRHETRGPMEPIETYEGQEVWREM